MGKKVLIVGGGGREHALAQAFSESPTVDSIICSPGNAGTSRVDGCRNAMAAGIPEIVELARRESVDFVVPGPEEPLARGIIDSLREAGIAGFGPPAKSARLESSKGFARDFMVRNRVASPAYRRFDDAEAAIDAVDSFGFPVVVKADGLAAGKGVVICRDRDEAAATVEAMMVAAAFGDAGREIVLEECLSGWETSIIGITDGDCFLPFLPARDHKRAGEGDEGLNTGGMGVVAPHPLVTEEVMDDIRRSIVEPTMRGLSSENLVFPGFLFIGVMVTPAGAKTLEYNVRFGDPEAQALLPLLAGNLDTYVQAALDGKLVETTPQWHSGASCTLVMASGGYPASYRSGFPITGIDAAERLGCRVYLAGAETAEDGGLVTSGGRVLGVTAVADSLAEARRMAYGGIEQVGFQNSWYRRDIGR